MGVLCSSFFGVHYIMSFLVFSIFLTRKREQVALLLLSFRCLDKFCKCHVALPHDALGWSAVCNCGIC